MKEIIVPVVYNTVDRCGRKEITDALTNLLVMVLSGLMSSSLMFPTISGGGIIVTWIVSKFFFKEKLTTMQNAGVILGIAAVVILSI